MVSFDVNWLAVVVSALVPMAVGMLWYGPMFGARWMKLVGFTKKDMEKAKKDGMAKTYVWAFIFSLIMSFVLANFVGYGAGAGLATAFWLWLGFVLTVGSQDVLWAKKNVNLFYINAGYNLVAMLIMGLILGSWA